MDKSKEGMATLTIHRIDNLYDQVLTALSALRLEYVLRLAKELGIEAQPEYDIDRHSYSVDITGPVSKIVELVEACYDVGLANFDVMLEDENDDVKFDRIMQLGVVTLNY